MEAFLGSIKKRWSSVAQFAAWILTITSVFIITPPVINYTDENGITPVTSFIVAALTAILYIPIRIRSRKKDYKLWYRISIATIILFIGTFAFYFQKSEHWTVTNYDVHLVIGDNLVPEASTARDAVERTTGQSITDKDFVRYRPEHNDSLWPSALLKERLYILRITYVITLLLAATFIISILQAIYCNELTKRNLDPVL